MSASALAESILTKYEPVIGLEVHVARTAHNVANVEGAKRRVMHSSPYRVQCSGGKDQVLTAENEVLFVIQVWRVY